MATKTGTRVPDERIIGRFCISGTINTARFDVDNHRSFVGQSKPPDVVDLLRRHIVKLTARENRRPLDTLSIQLGTLAIQPLDKRKRRLPAADESNSGPSRFFGRCGSISYCASLHWSPAANRSEKSIMRAYSIPLMLAALSMAVCSADAAEIKRTLTLYAPKPVWSHLDLGTEGPTHGDMRIFEAPVTGENDIKGVIHGILITVDIADGENVDEDRSGQIHVDLGGGNSIVIAGRSVFVDNSPEMAVDAPQIRAVIGGTGDYIGATGQMTTARNADGSYEMFFELLN